VTGGKSGESKHEESNGGETIIIRVRDLFSCELKHLIRTAGEETCFKIKKTSKMEKVFQIYA